MKALRVVGYVLAALVALAILGVVAAALIVDGAFVKSRLEHRMKELGRTLTIEGEPRVRLFPVAGITLGRTLLTEPSSSDVFVSLESADVAVHVLALLAGDLDIERVAVSGLQANVRRFKDGRMNFDDLAGEKRESPGPPAGGQEAPPKEEPGKAGKLRVGEAVLERIRVNYVDEATRREIRLQDFTLKTGRLDAGTPSPLALSMSLTGRNPEMALNARVSGNVRLDPPHGVAGFTGLEARVTGDAATLKKLDFRVTGSFNADQRVGVLDVEGLKLALAGIVEGDALSAELSAPKLSVNAAKATGAAITGHASLSGPKRRMQAKLEVAAVEGSASSVSIPAVELRFDGADDGNVFSGRVSAPVQASLVRQTLELPKLVAELSASGSKVPGKQARLPLQASVKADFARQRINAEVAAQPDGANVRLVFAANRLKPLEASFDLNADRLDVDRLLLPVPARHSKPDGAIDLSALGTHKVTGKIRIGSLQAGKVKAADVAAEVRLAAGRLEVSPHSARLYDGTLKGAMTADARGNRVALKETLEGVSINPLLRDLADKDLLEGRGDVVLDVEASGRSVEAMKRALSGTARVHLKDGAYKGVDLGALINVLRARGPMPSGPGQRTPFSEMSASFVIKGGVAHNEDLVLHSPNVQAGGSGDVDVGNSRLDYTVRPTLSTGGSSLTVPVHIQGAFDALRYEPDYRALAASGALDRLGGRLGEVLGGKQQGGKGGAAPSSPESPRDVLRDAVRERLKGLLGR